MPLRPPLKDARLLEGPGAAVGLLPVAMRPDRGGGLEEIGLMVGAEEEAGPRPRRRRRRGEESGRHEPVLVVAPLGPRVREEDEDGGEAGARRHRRQEILGVGLHEMQVRQVRAGLLSLGPRDPFRGDVDADAGGLRMGGGVGREEMAVAAAHFLDEARPGRKEREQPFSKGLAAP
jgi:hypothetical protein